MLILSSYFREACRSIPTTVKLADLFSSHGVDVTVLTSKAKSKRMFKENKHLKVVETSDIYFRDPYNLNIMPWLPFRLMGLLWREKFDAVIISKYIFYPIFMVPLLKLLGKKVIVVTDTYPGIVWFARSEKINRLARVYTWFVKYLLRWADKVVLTHEEIVEATKQLGIKRFEVIHNGIDLTVYDEAVQHKEHVDVRICYVGRLASVKGVDVLYDAARRVKQKYPKAKFVMVGDGDIRTKLSNVEFIGFQENVIDELLTSDIFVMPSFSEGLPSAVVEAMACGLPVVASDIPGGMKVLVNNGFTGLTFKKGDANDLAEKLELLIGSAELRKTMGYNARLFVKKEFDEETVYSQWRVVIENYLSKE